MVNFLDNIFYSLSTLAQFPEKNISSLLISYRICLECPSGYFGNDCKSECSANCFDNTLCDHTNGTCLRGCKDGYEGEQCTTGESN